MCRIARLMSLCAALFLPAANASTIFTLDTTIGGVPIAATAEFSWSGSTLEIILTNDTDSISKTIQELTGIHFVLSGTPVLLDISGSALGGSVNCIGVADGDPCPTLETGPVDPFAVPPDLGNGGSPQGWGAVPNYALFTFGAGNGSWKPYGIVNENIIGTGNNSNTSNPQHNPMLIGPVVFELVFAPFDVAPTISGVDFYWGTSADHRAGTLCTSPECGTPSGDIPQVPEPASGALLAGALMALTLMLRRARHTAFVAQR